MSMESVVPALYASAPEAVPFGPSLEIRAFLLQRERGNLLVYRAETLKRDEATVHQLGGISRQYLNHRHEAAPACDWVSEAFGAPLFCHASDAESASRRAPSVLRPCAARNTEDARPSAGRARCASSGYTTVTRAPKMAPALGLKGMCPRSPTGGTRHRAQLAGGRGFGRRSRSSLSTDKSTGTVWFSGLVTAGNDLRLPVGMQQQEQSIIAAGNMILYGRLRDSNGDGSADQRSLFITQATTAYPNALLSSGDNGTIATPWFINGNATSAGTACLLHDSAFQTADYEVVDGPSNQVQWLEPDDSTPVGSPITGTATNLMNPPAQSVYSLASINRTLLSPTLYMTLR
jgi:hypothetical protein